MAQSQTTPAENEIAGTGPDTCSTKTDPSAPAGSKNSLGAKSDCNGRPTSDDSVVEAMDEQGPITTPPTPQPGGARH
jgi:hypothetical protein